MVHHYIIKAQRNPVLSRIPGPLKDIRHAAYCNSSYFRDSSHVLQCWVYKMLFGWRHKSARERSVDHGGHTGVPCEHRMLQQQIKSSNLLRALRLKDCSISCAVLPHSCHNQCFHILLTK